MGKTKVLVVDDSALVRKTLCDLINETPDMEVTAVASDPYIAVAKIRKDVPDVITLDIEMPRMNGLVFLQKLMSQHPIPVVVVSSLSTTGSKHALEALGYGAIGVFNKEDFKVLTANREKAGHLLELIRTAKISNIKRHRKTDEIPVIPEAVVHVENKLPRLIVVGASTGGTVAIKAMLRSMPQNAPGMVVVQHMPKTFTSLFAEELDRCCALTVKEAQNCEEVQTGKVLVAPGDRHVVIKRHGNRLMVCLSDQPKVNNHRPSVDVLFKSAALHAGEQTTGVLLTGMGKDGAEGLKMIRENGGFTIAQDEESSVVYGMPREAVALNAADMVLPLHDIAKFVLSRR